MTTKTYQALCDDVGAYELKKSKVMQDMPACDRPSFMMVEVYPPVTTEQRERLEELILNLGRLSYHKSDIYYICILSRVNNANNGMAGTRAEALYALTHKLVAEKVLSKEEVKEALC